MLNPDEHYNQTLGALTGKAQMYFMLKAALLVDEWLRINALPKTYRASSGLNGALVVDNSKRNAAARRYFRGVGVSAAVMEVYMSQGGPGTISGAAAAAAAADTNGKTETLRARSTAEAVMYEDVKCCEFVDVIMLSDSAVCAGCGTQVKDSAQFTANFADAAIAPSTTLKLTSDTNTVYSTPEKAALLVEPLLCLQGVRMTAFKEKDWIKMYKSIVYGINDVTRISTAHVSRVIHDLKMKAYYKDVYVIWERITGNALERIPDAVIWATTHVIASQLALDKDDKTRITGAPLMFKCLQLCGMHRTAERVTMQNMDACLENLGPVWRKTCLAAGWKLHADTQNRSITATASAAAKGNRGAMTTLTPKKPVVRKKKAVL